MPELEVLDRDFPSEIDGGKISVHCGAAVDNPAPLENVLPPALMNMAADNHGGSFLFDEVANRCAPDVETNVDNVHLGSIGRGMGHEHLDRTLLDLQEARLDPPRDFLFANLVGGVHRRNGRSRDSKKPYPVDPHTHGIERD